MIRGREGNVPQPDELNAFLGKNREEAAGNISGTGIVAGGDSLCGGQGENGAVRCGLQCCQFGIEQGYQRENTLLSVNSGTFSIPIVLSDVTARGKQPAGVEGKNGKEYRYRGHSCRCSCRRTRDRKRE